MRRTISLLLAAVLVIGAVWTAPPARAAGKKLIAITYDDGPGPYTAGLLDGLKARGAKATFFMLGNRVSMYSSTVERVYREGHQVANHSYDHSELTSLSESGVRSQIQSTNRQLDKICGKGADYLVRAPYGSVSSTVFRAAGAPLVLWSVDPQDWRYRNAETVKNNIISSAHDGAIVLVHDIHPTSIPGSLAAIDYLKSRGYEFVTVRELFRRKGQTLKNGVQYGSCRGSGRDPGPVKAPTVATEVQGSKLLVTIKAQAGASVYYATGSGKLNQESKKYTGPFLVDSPCKLKAVAAFNMNGSRSDTVEQTLAKPKTKRPRLRVSEGTLSIECATAGADIYYTLIGAGGSGGEQLYTGPAPIQPGTEASAYAVCRGYFDSERAWVAYSARENIFADVRPGQWYYEAMDRAAAAGYLSGEGEGVFSPEKGVTRGQLVTMLYKYSGEGAEGTSPAGFVDVRPGEYYSEPVAWAYGSGIVSGYDDNTFKPDKGVSRQEMAVIFYNFLRYVKKAPEDDPAEGAYTDAEDIAPWAAEAVGHISSIGLMSGVGDGYFKPEKGATRGQAASVLMTMADYCAVAPEQGVE